MSTQAQIEGMRYCTVVYGGLNITLNDPSADFSAFFDITTLLGLWVLMHKCQWFLTATSAGPLVINNSSMVSLDAFAHLTTITPINGLVEMEGQEYSVILSGLIHVVHVSIVAVVLVLYWCECVCWIDFWVVLQTMRSLWTWTTCLTSKPGLQMERM